MSLLVMEKGLLIGSTQTGFHLDCKYLTGFDVVHRDYYYIAGSVETCPRMVNLSIR
jgi:hypothetical protein